MSRTPIQACQASENMASVASIWPTGTAKKVKVKRFFQPAYVNPDIVRMPTSRTMVYTARMIAVTRWMMNSPVP